MARWRAVNSSCMGTSVVRPLAVAHGRYSRRRQEAEEAHSAPEADVTDSERNDQQSVRFNKNGTISCRKKRNDQLSVRTYGCPLEGTGRLSPHGRLVLQGWQFAGARTKREGLFDARYL